VRKQLAVVALFMLLAAGMGSSALVARAFAQTHQVSAVQEEKRVGPKPTPSWYWRWVQWRLGEGYAKGHARTPRLRPRRAPQQVPNWAWQKLHYFLLARQERLPAAEGSRGHRKYTTTTADTTTAATPTTTAATTTAATTTTTTGTTTTTPPPSTATIKGYYDQGSNLNDWNSYKQYGFNTVFADTNTSVLDQIKADGASAWVQPNIWTGCGYEYDNATALGYAKTAVATGAVSGFYVADEPSTSGCPTAPAQIAAWTATLHANFPGIPTIIATYDSTDLTDFAHSADMFALDTYPCQYGNGCDYSWITSLAATADKLGVNYVGVVQAFGGDSAGHYDLPTASQLQQIINTWQATNELGYVVYAFSAAGMPSSTWLQNDPGLLSVIAAN
jgi:hypothetical protein